MGETVVASEVATVVDEAVETVVARAVDLGLETEEALESLQACLALAGTEVESRTQSQCSFAHKTHLRPFRVQSDCDTNACCHQAA